jgi:acetyl-CoA C-acetyltransferase
VPAVIVSAVRVPTGKFLGALKSLTAPQLGALVVREAVARAGLDPATIDECLMGNVVSAGLGQNPARQAALGAGLDPRVSATTINQVCGSGLKAVMLAMQAIAAGDSRIVVAGGMESMSRAPYLLPGAREGQRLGNAEMIDSVIHDGLWCACENWHMGMTGEAVAEKYGVSRIDQDAYAVASHQKAVAARAAGAFVDEILPVTIAAKKGPPTIVDRDEAVREDTTPATLGALKPAFTPTGTVTAGNAPGLNDGAAALVVMSEADAAARGLTPLARIVAQATSGLEPKWVMMTPVEATRMVLQKAGWAIGDVDLFEINEAFAVQAVAVTGELGLDPAKVNVHGGAVALGHPIGASGARIVLSLMLELKRRGGGLGLAGICSGGGQGDAIVIQVGG